MANSIVERYLDDGSILEIITNGLHETKTSHNEKRTYALYTAIDFQIRKLKLEDKNTLLPILLETCHKYGVYPQTGLTDNATFDLDYLKLSPSGKLYVGLGESRDHNEQKYELIVGATGKQRPLFKLPLNKWYSTYEFSPNDRYLAIENEGTLFVWDLESLDLVIEKELPEARGCSISWSEDCIHLAVSKQDMIEIIDVLASISKKLSLDSIPHFSSSYSGVALSDTGEKLLVYGNGITVYDIMNEKTIIREDGDSYSPENFAAYKEGSFYLFANNGVYTISEKGVSWNHPENDDINTHTNRLFELLNEPDILSSNLHLSSYCQKKKTTYLSLENISGSTIDLVYDIRKNEFTRAERKLVRPTYLTTDKVFQGFNPFSKTIIKSADGTFYQKHEDGIYGYTPISVGNNRYVKMYRRKFVSPGMDPYAFMGAFVDPTYFPAAEIPENISDIKFEATYQITNADLTNKTVLVNSEYKEYKLDSRFAAYSMLFRDNNLQFDHVDYEENCYCTKMIYADDEKQVFLAFNNNVWPVIIPNGMHECQYIGRGFFEDSEWIYRYDFSKKEFVKVIAVQSMERSTNLYGNRIVSSVQGMTVSLHKGDVYDQSRLNNHELYLIENNNLEYICDCPENGFGIVTENHIITFEGYRFSIRNRSDKTIVSVYSLINRDEWIANGIDEHKTLWLIRLKSKDESDCKISVARMIFPYDSVEPFNGVEIPLQDPWSIGRCLSISNNQAMILERTGRSSHYQRLTQYKLGKQAVKGRSLVPKSPRKEIAFLDMGSNYLAIHNDDEANEIQTRNILMDPLTGSPLKMSDGPGGQMFGPTGFFIREDSKPFLFKDRLIAQLTDGRTNILMSWDTKTGRRYPDKNREPIQAVLMGHDDTHIFAGISNNGLINERLLLDKDLLEYDRRQLHVPLKTDGLNNLSYIRKTIELDGYVFKGKKYTKLHIPRSIECNNEPQVSHRIVAMLSNFEASEEYVPGPEHPVISKPNTGGEFRRVPAVLCTLEYGMISNETEAILEFECTPESENDHSKNELSLTNDMETGVYAAFHNGAYYVLQQRAYEGQYDKSEFLWRLAIFRNGKTEYINRIVGPLNLILSRIENPVPMTQILETGSVSYVKQREDLSQVHMIDRDEIFELGNDMRVSVYCDKDVSVSFDDTSNKVYIVSESGEKILGDIQCITSLGRKGDELALLHGGYDFKNVTTVEIPTLICREYSVQEYTEYKRRLCGKKLVNLVGTYVLEDSE